MNGLKEAEEFGEFAIDTETSSLDPHQANLVGISLSTKIGKACYIPIGHVQQNNLQEKDVIKKTKTNPRRYKHKKNWAKY